KHSRASFHSYPRTDRLFLSITNVPPPAPCAACARILISLKNWTVSCSLAFQRGHKIDLTKRATWKASWHNCPPKAFVTSIHAKVLRSVGGPLKSPNEQSDQANWPFLGRR